MLFDFSKAFDSILHRRLLQKLRTFYLRNPTITWIYNYICERYQAVMNEDTLFINDLSTILRCVLYMLYADDEQVNGHFTSAEINAQAVFDWVTENGLELNVRKTKAIFGSTRNLAMLPNGLPQIKINGSAIPNVEQAKNFGLLMPPSLNWQSQITSITNKVYTKLSSLKFHRKSLNLPLKKQLIQTLALPHFHYASKTFMNFDKTRALSLQTVHNACIRFIFGSIPPIPTANIRSHLTHRRFHLGWLSITGRQHLKLASLYLQKDC